jgi:hypothetical protein
LVIAGATTFVATLTIASAVVQGHIVIHAVAWVLATPETPRWTALDQAKQSVTVTKSASVECSVKAVCRLSCMYNNQSRFG